MFRKHRYWLICAVVGAAAVVSLKLAQRGHAPANIASGELAPALPGIVEGRLRVGAFGAGLSGSHTGHEPLRHISVYVNGPDYGGMEDNDMRGFLDGRCKHDWNQQGQIHVRPGGAWTVLHLANTNSFASHAGGITSSCPPTRCCAGRRSNSTWNVDLGQVFG